MAMMRAGIAALAVCPTETELCIDSVEKKKTMLNTPARVISATSMPNNR